MMKTTLSVLLLSCAASYATTYVNHIVETHYLSDDPNEDPVYEYHTNIDNVSSAKGKKGVLFETVYELFVQNKDDVTEEYLLDTKTVYTNAPSAELTIISDDKKTSQPRTRADKPFYVTYSVSNLTPESEVSDKRFNSVVLHYLADDGTEGQEILKENVTAKTVAYSPMNHMAGSDATATSGTIDFSINENAASNADEFASQNIQILPKHVGSMNGLTAGEAYYNLPNLSLNMTNMYPGSTTVLYAYKNDSPTELKFIQNGKIQNLSNTEMHSFSDVTVSELDKVINESGDWTIVWMLTETPWDDEIINQVTVEKKVSLKVRGNLNSSN